MARKRWIQRDGKLYEVGVDVLPEDTRPMSATVLGDLPDFVSPIDGRLVNGRAGMRDHCKRHNVVPTAELAGLPPKPANQEYVPDRAAIRESIRRQLHK